MSVRNLNDLSETNSKLKWPIWNLRNLKDLSETNSKLKWPIWNLRNLKDLSETNVKLKGPREVFGLKFYIVGLIVREFDERILEEKRVEEVMYVLELLDICHGKAINIDVIIMAPIIGDVT